MPGFEALYKQTITLFNRKSDGFETIWYPFIIKNVHLIIDKAVIIGSYGEQSQDNARVHIRYKPTVDGAVVDGKLYLPQKEWGRVGDPDYNFTLAFGDDYDFFIEGEFDMGGPISDEDYNNGFYNFMNKKYDNVYVITSVSKFNLIPHFEIGAK